MKQLKETASTW